MVPRFCPIHLKIHVCDDQKPENINKRIDANLGSKVRRLHGTQTEEELEKIAKKVSAPAKKGTLQWILENAKKQNEKVKSKYSTDEDEITSSDKMMTGVSDNVLNSRVAMLKKRLEGGQKTPFVEEKIDISKLDPNKKLTLQQILQIAKQKNDLPGKNKEYVPPKKSDIHPKRKVGDSMREKSIYQANTLNLLEKEIDRARVEYEEELKNKKRSPKK